MPVPPRGEEKGGNGPFSDKLSSPNRPNRQNPMTFYFLPAKGRKCQWVLFGGGTGMYGPGSLPVDLHLGPKFPRLFKLESGQHQGLPIGRVIRCVVLDSL